MSIIIEARVRLLADYQWESVEPVIRTLLLDTFGFERRELGQPMFRSEVLGTIQGIPGVDYVELEAMGGVDPDTLQNYLTTSDLIKALKLKPPKDVRPSLAQIHPQPIIPNQPFLPAQMAFVDSNVPETLILEEMP
ncbi:MAG: hypothetical protein ACXWPS_17170 [Ktedonobacteraceae bacterium]